MRRYLRLFFPSCDTASNNGVSLAFWFLLAALAVLVGLAYETIHFDQPFLISSASRALYVDEGFYSDGAQNFAKFGRWGFHLDFPHWSAAPMCFPFSGPAWTPPGCFLYS